MPDIHGRRKLLLAGALALLAAGFAAGFYLARKPIEAPEKPSSSAIGSRTARQVEVRIDTSYVRLANTGLELRTLPPPPSQNLSVEAQKP